jgi:hypothetical protein
VSARPRSPPAAAGISRFIARFYLLEFETIRYVFDWYHARLSSVRNSIARNVDQAGIDQASIGYASRYRNKTRPQY